MIGRGGEQLRSGDPGGDVDGDKDEGDEQGDVAESGDIDGGDIDGGDDDDDRALVGLKRFSSLASLLIHRPSSLGDLDRSRFSDVFLLGGVAV